MGLVPCLFDLRAVVRWGGVCFSLWIQWYLRGSFLVGRRVVGLFFLLGWFGASLLFGSWFRPFTFSSVVYRPCLSWYGAFAAGTLDCLVGACYKHCVVNGLLGILGAEGIEERFHASKKHLWCLITQMITLADVKGHICSRCRKHFCRVEASVLGPSRFLALLLHQYLLARLYSCYVDRQLATP